MAVIDNRDENKVWVPIVSYWWESFWVWNLCNIMFCASWHTLIAREWKCLNVNLWKFLSISPLFSSPTTQSYILVKSQRFLMATLKTPSTNPHSLTKNFYLIDNTHSLTFVRYICLQFFWWFSDILTWTPNRLSSGPCPMNSASLHFFHHPCIWVALTPSDELRLW